MTETTVREKFQEFLAKAKLDTKEHQIAGVEWCVNNEVSGHVVNGKTVRCGLVADEMGLGKTIQMIGAIICNFKRHTLIVLPRALLEQWEDAIIRTLNHTPLIYHGSARVKDYTEENLEAAPIIITTYGMVSKKTSPLHQIKWDRVIFDEAHHLRNANTAVHKNTLKLRSGIRWLMTGTPIQNRKSDFYALCAQMGLPEAYYSNPSNLTHLANSFLLRRTKKEVNITLPTLTIETTEVTWETKEERDLAEDIHSLLQFSNVDPTSERQVNNKITALDMATLTLLVRARQACIYPRLMENKFDDLIQIGAIDDSAPLIKATRGDCSTSKLNAVTQHITERKDNGASKIVFCHYRGEIDEIKHRLMRQDMTVETFDGRTPQRERERILTTTECDVLILQIQTGCEGLNLQHFSEVYFVSPHWNPAIEDQAIARCHRIGQLKETRVFRFNMAGFDTAHDEPSTTTTATLEEYSIEVQNAKREIMTILDE
jgi:SNF2 family DNA or RNA helicase